MHVCIKMLSWIRLIVPLGKWRALPHREIPRGVRVAIHRKSEGLSVCADILWEVKNYSFALAFAVALVVELEASCAVASEKGTRHCSHLLG